MEVGMAVNNLSYSSVRVVHHSPGIPVLSGTLLADPVDKKYMKILGQLNIGFYK